MGRNWEGRKGLSNNEDHEIRARKGRSSLAEREGADDGSAQHTLAILYSICMAGNGIPNWRFGVGRAYEWASSFEAGLLGLDGVVERCSYDGMETWVCK